MTIHFMYKNIQHTHTHTNWLLYGICMETLGSSSSQDMGFFQLLKIPTFDSRILLLLVLLLAFTFDFASTVESLLLCSALLASCSKCHIVILLPLFGYPKMVLFSLILNAIIPQPLPIGKVLPCDNAIHKILTSLGKTIQRNPHQLSGCNDLTYGCQLISY